MESITARSSSDQLVIQFAVNKVNGIHEYQYAVSQTVYTMQGD